MLMEDINRTEVARRLATTLARRGLKNRELAAAVGVTDQAVSFWLRTGKIATARLPNVAAFLDVSTDWLLRGDLRVADLVAEYRTEREPDRQRFEAHYVPLLDMANVAATNVDDVRTGPMVPICSKLHRILHGRGFAVQIGDDAMAPELKPSDLIIVDSGGAPHPGDVVLAQLPNEEACVLRRFRARPHNSFELYPVNDNYPTITVNRGSGIKVIYGVARELRRAM